MCISCIRRWAPMNPVTLTIRQTTDSSWTTVPVRNGALREGQMSGRGANVRSQLLVLLSAKRCVGLARQINRSFLRYRAPHNDRRRIDFSPNYLDGLSWPPAERGRGGRLRVEPAGLASLSSFKQPARQSYRCCPVARQFGYSSQYQIPLPPVQSL